MKALMGRVLRGLSGIAATLFEPLITTSEGDPESIGYSLEKRPIVCHRLGSGPLHVLIVGGIHGNEIGTVKLVYRLISQLSREESAWNHLTIHCIPCLNPDGLAVAQDHPGFFSGGKLGRLNARGVDLNRNFPSQNFTSRSVWAHGKNYQESTEVFCGETAASEPEIQALLSHISAFRPEVYVAFHSAGRDVMGSSDALGQKLAAAFSKATNYRLQSHEKGRGLGQTGTAGDWCQENGITYVEVEASSRWGSDWKKQKAGIQQILKELQAS